MVDLVAPLANPLVAKERIVATWLKHDHRNGKIELPEGDPIRGETKDSIRERDRVHWMNRVIFPLSPEQSNPLYLS